MHTESSPRAQVNVIDVDQLLLDCLHTAVGRISDTDKESKRKVVRISLLKELLTNKRYVEGPEYLGNIFPIYQSDYNVLYYPLFVYMHVTFQCISDYFD